VYLLLVPLVLRHAYDQPLCMLLLLQARAFVRASGTEDAVRVYAEAATQAAADRLAARVAQVGASERCTACV
jgi:phosphomannomutase